MDCIFCKIVNKEILNFTVYENDSVIAFLDINPHATGHTVLIPKKHFSTLEEMSESDWEKIAVGLKNVQDKLRKDLKPEGFNIGINDGRFAGQVVPHVHWHIFPRFLGDSGSSVHAIVKNDASLSAAKTAEMLK